MEQRLAAEWSQRCKVRLSILVELGVESGTITQREGGPAALGKGSGRLFVRFVGKGRENFSSGLPSASLYSQRACQATRYPVVVFPQIQPYIEFQGSFSIVHIPTKDVSTRIITLTYTHCPPAQKLSRCRSMAHQ